MMRHGRSLTPIAVTIGCGLSLTLGLSGCGTSRSDGERLEVAGLYQHIDPATIPAAGQDIIEIPIADDHAADGLPIDERGNLVVVGSRRAWFRQTGRHAPDPIPDVDVTWRKHADAQRALQGAIYEINTMLANVRSLQQTLNAIRSNDPDAVRMSDAAKERFAELVDEVTCWTTAYQAATQVAIPVPSHPEARVDRLLDVAYARRNDLEAAVRGFLRTGLMQYVANATALPSGLVKDGHANTTVSTLISDCERHFSSMDAALQNRDLAGMLAASGKIRETLRSFDLSKAWKSIENRSDSVYWLETPSPRDAAISKHAWRLVLQRSTELWAAAAGAVFRLAPVQDTPVLVYEQPVAP